LAQAILAQAFEALPCAPFAVYRSSRCAAAMDVEEQQQLVAPLAGAVPGLRFSGSTFLKVVVGSCAALLATAAVVKAPSAWLHQQKQHVATMSPALEYMQQLAEAHGKISAAAEAAQATKDDCKFAKDASMVCTDEEEAVDGGAATCDESCLNIFLDIEANCAANDKRVQAAKAVLKKCKNKSPVPPSLAEEQESGKLPVTEIDGCAMAAVEISTNCVLPPPDVDTMCKKTCVDALTRNKGVCKNSVDQNLHASVKMLLGYCSGCSGALLKLQSPAAMRACSINPGSPKPEWEPCDDECHPIACDLALKCKIGSAEMSHCPPTVSEEIQMLVGSDKFKSCSCST